MGILRSCCLCVPAAWTAGLVLLAANALLRAPPARLPPPAEAGACSSAAPPAAAAPAVRQGAEFDVILYGATGFTGKLAAHYLARAEGGFSYALAGRSKGKLEALAADVGKGASGTGPPRKPKGIIVADSDDLPALKAMVRRAKVVLTVVGPYLLYGSKLVQACVEEAVHYADLSGESPWHRQVIDKHHEAARSNGAKIVLAAGYDSVPFDVATVLALRELEKATGKTGGAATVVSAVTSMCGAASGSTLQAGMQAQELMVSGQVPAEWDNDPYLLVPNAKCRVDTSVSGWGTHLRKDPLLGMTGVAHFMAVTNSRIVRRTLELIGRRNVSYSEGLTLGGMRDAAACFMSFVSSGELPLAPPKPGEGPPPSMQLAGYYNVTVAARDDASGQSIRLEGVGFGDPGYRHTSKLLVEVGLCLAEPSCHRKGAGGGVVTPAGAVDLEQIVARLRRATHEDGRPLLTYALVGAPGSQTAAGKAVEL